MTRNTISLVMLAGLAAACSPSDDNPAAGGGNGGGKATVARAGSAGPELRHMEWPQLVDRLQGELRCAWVGSDDRVLLVAAGDVDPSAHGMALIDVGQGPVRLESRDPGGFDAMVDGAGFQGETFSAAVVTGPQEQTGTEEIRYPAELRVGSQAGETRISGGVWTCGP